MNMELGLGNTLLAGDPRLVDHIVGEVKSQGIFDQFRKECIADVDTKPAYQNLRTRVESSVNSFLGKQTWKADLNKNQLRETLRKHIVEAPYLDAGVERIVDQVVNPKVYSVFMPQIEDVVYKFLGLERPKNRQRNGPCGFKDLLPKDLDPVSPESDKNSLKDVSLDSVDAHVENPEPREKETSISSIEQSRKDDADINSNDKDIGRNGDAEIEEKPMDDPAKSSAAVNLNSSVKSEDKTEEEEEDSPTFEPIDIMNLNESNISNDSHLSGISELTSHRSRSPDFSNDASRDNMDFSNQDSQFSKVSSDSRLSIVTDFGSSNHASTPVSDAVKDDKNESKYSKDNFKAVREFESGKGNKDGRSSYESERSKENTPSDFKPLRRSLSSKETSRDGMESGAKDSQRNDSKSRRTESRDSKKEREKDNRKKSNNHESKSSEKSSKKSVKEKPEEKSRERDREKEKKEPEKKDKVDGGKEAKDLKDIYKEKIRELREKKELTEKEKLSKDKDLKATKDTKEKRDSSRDKRDSKEQHKSSSSKSSSSSRSDNKNSKSSASNESKGTKSESRDKGKRDERRYSKDYKSKSSSAPSDEKGEGKRVSRSDEKTEKSDVKDSRQKTVVKKDSKNGDKRESKSEADKEKKRREEKKSKAKDDHSSLRKNSEDRRSTDRDGSNGSNGKTSQKSASNSGASSTKPSASNLPKESTNTSNSSSETSDSIEESQNEKLRLSSEAKNIDNGKNTREYESQAKKLDLGQNEISLPIKKRPFDDGSAAGAGEVLMKKPKFAKNFQEAKRLMKIRRKMEKEKIKRQQEEMEKNVKVPTTPEIKETAEKNDLELVPDDERVQIIEVRDEEYDEPYPEIQSSFTLEERSQIILGGESIFMGDLPITEFKTKSTLSEMEHSIRQSLNEMISDKKIEETQHTLKNKESTAGESECKSNEFVECPKEISCETESSSNAEETLAKDSTEPEAETPEVTELPAQTFEKSGNNENVADIGNKVNKEKLGGAPEIEINESVLEAEKEENKEKLAETETGDNKGKVFEIGSEENKEKVAENETGENKGEVVKIESEGNAENASEPETKEKAEETVEPETKENAEEMVETETKENAEEMVETLTKENKGKATEMESEEKMAETESDENMEAVIERENEENKKEVLEIKNEENVEMVAGIKNEENGQMVSDIKHEENEEKELGIKNEENEVKGLDTKNEENKEKELAIKNEETEEKELDMINEENEENVVVTETCTKEDETVSKPEDAQILETSDNIEAIKSLPNNEEVSRSDSEEKPETLENPVTEVQSPIDVLVSEVPAKMEGEAETCESIAVKITETSEEMKIKCRESPARGEEDLAYLSSDEVPCLYFEEDNERLEKFTKFMKALEQEDESTSSSSEPAADTVDSMGADEAVSSLSKPMAPPKLKRKYSTSPLTDILLNNANNNNDAHKITTAIVDDEVEPNILKKRKIGRPKKQRSSASLCGQQNLLNGENFVMPLSPESDVSATSEKTPSNPLKDDKSRPRGSNQRYTSDDLYKPRPLFASSSRRSRRTNPA